MYGKIFPYEDHELEAINESLKLAQEKYLGETNRLKLMVSSSFTAGHSGNYHFSIKHSELLPDEKYLKNEVISELKKIKHVRDTYMPEIQPLLAVKYHLREIGESSKLAYLVCESFLNDEITYYELTKFFGREALSDSYRLKVSEMDAIKYSKETKSKFIRSSYIENLMNVWSSNSNLDILKCSRGAEGIFMDFLDAATEPVFRSLEADKLVLSTKFLVSRKTLQNEVRGILDKIGKLRERNSLN